MRFLTNIIGKNKRGNMTEFKVGDRVVNDEYGNKEKGQIKVLTEGYCEILNDDGSGYQIHPTTLRSLFKKIKPLKPLEEGDRVVLIDSNIKLIIGKKGKIVSSHWGTQFQVELDNNEGSIVISSEKLRRLVKKKKKPEPKFKVGDIVEIITGRLGDDKVGVVLDVRFYDSEKYYVYDVKGQIDLFSFTYREDRLRIHALYEVAENKIKKAEEKPIYDINEYCWGIISEKYPIKSLKDSIESIKDTVNSQKSQIDRNLSKINELEKKNKEKDLKINTILNEFGKDINYLSGVARYHRQLISDMEGIANEKT